MGCIVRIKESVKKDMPLLVEGYMDVIALQNAGFPNAVASLGTALTRDQAKLLRRYTQRVVLLYDSDASGNPSRITRGRNSP